MASKYFQKMLSPEKSINNLIAYASKEMKQSSTKKK